MAIIAETAKKVIKEKIKLFLAQGLSDKAIAKNLGVHRHTVTNYLRQIKEEENKILDGRHILARKQLKYLLEIQDELESIKKEHWKIYNNSKDSKAKTKLLENIITRIDRELTIIAKLLEPFISDNVNIEEFVPVSKVKKIMDAIAKIIEEYVPRELKIKAIEKMASINI